ncbi:MAG: hypothetical protein ACI86S_002625, partial [Paracoccaceae bacterium]
MFSVPDVVGFVRLSALSKLVCAGVQVSVGQGGKTVKQLPHPGAVDIGKCNAQLAR